MKPLSRFGARSGVAVGVLVVGLALMALVGMADRAFSATPFKLLTGSWSGWGWVELHGGGRERVRCKSKNRLKGSNRLQQKIRCASTSYKISASLMLKSAGSKVSGEWSEVSFQSAGTVSGTANAHSMNLQLIGTAFSAGLTASIKNCSQTVTISVSGLDIRRVTMDLNKRC